VICLSNHRHALHCMQGIPASSFVIFLLPAFACTACKKFHGQTKKELRAHSSNYPLVCSLPRLLPSLAPLAFVTCPALDGAVIDAPAPCDLGVHLLPSLLQLGLVCLFLLRQRSANHFVFFARGGVRCSTTLIFFLCGSSTSSSPDPLWSCMFA